MTRIKVLLVDDHLVVREGLRRMLQEEPGIEVAGEAADGEEAIQKTDELQPDVVLMDIGLPAVDGIEATRRIKAAHPTTAVIMLTVHGNEIYVVESIRAGAAGYLTKDCSPELLSHTVRTVTEGGTLLPSWLLQRAVQAFVRQPGNAGEAQASLANRLSGRELEVLRLVAQGLSNREICGQLYLAEVTVKKYVQSIAGKLGASDRTQAAVLGVRLGLIA